MIYACNNAIREAKSRSFFTFKQERSISLFGKSKAMDYLSNNISKNLNRIRISRGWSLDAAAEQTGVSKSMLYQIEQGIAKSNKWSLRGVAFIFMHILRLFHI